MNEQSLQTLQHSSIWTKAWKKFTAGGISGSSICIGAILLIIGLTPPGIALLTFGAIVAISMTIYYLQQKLQQISSSYSIPRVASTIIHEDKKGIFLKDGYHILIPDEDDAHMQSNTNPIIDTFVPSIELIKPHTNTNETPRYPSLPSTSPSILLKPAPSSPSDSISSSISNSTHNLSISSNAPSSNSSNPTTPGFFTITSPLPYSPSILNELNQTVAGLPNPLKQYINDNISLFPFATADTPPLTSPKITSPMAPLILPEPSITNKEPIIRSLKI